MLSILSIKLTTILHNVLGEYGNTLLKDILQYVSQKYIGETCYVYSISKHNV